MSIVSLENNSKSRGVLSVYSMMILVLTIIIYISQSSINAYWQQTYHKSSPLEQLNVYKIWQSGAITYSYLNNAYTDFLENLDNVNIFSHDDALANEQAINMNVASTNINTKNIIESVIANNYINESNNQSATSIPVAETIAVETSETTSNKITEYNVTSPIVHGGVIQLHAGDNVFLAGDSLMQGVAPYIQQSLKKKYGINSINLSKQSTGLSYPKFFDWPKTIENTLKENPHIRLLIVLLGPNDPWDFPNPKAKSGPYLKFSSSEWESVYRQRINRIVQIANANNVKIIWVGIPYIKATKLNSQTRYLDKTIQNELIGKAIWIPTEQLVSGGSKQYVDTITISGQSVKIRSKDGVHFTPKGYQYLANNVMTHISLTSSNEVQNKRITSERSTEEDNNDESDEE